MENLLTCPYKSMPPTTSEIPSGDVAPKKTSLKEKRWVKPRTI